jgi:PAS domain S-box-containing protein
MTMKANFHYFTRTLRGRLILSVAAIHAVLMTFFIVDSTIRQYRILLDDHVEHTAALAESLAASSASWTASLDLSGLQELVASVRKHHAVAFAMLTAVDGRILAHTDRSKIGLYCTDLPKRPAQTVLHRKAPLIDVASPVFLNGVQVGWARVGIGQQDLLRRDRTVFRNGMIAALIAIILGSFIAGYLGLRFTRRLTTIQKAIDRVKAGDKTARSAMSGGDEAASLAREFNSMLDTLAERQRSEERFRALFDRSPDAYVIIELVGGVISDCNPSAEELLRADRTRIIGKTPAELSPRNQPDGALSVEALVERTRELLREGKLRYEWVFRRFDGSDIWVDVSVSTITLNDRSVFLATWRDVSDQKFVEQQLNDIVELNDKIVTSSSIGIFACRADGPCILANPAIAQISGTSIDKMLRLNFHELEQWKTNGLYQKVMTALRTRTEQHAEIALMTSFGRPVWLNFHISTFTSGGQLHFLLLADDITERKTIEAELTEREARYRSVFDSHSVMLLIDPENSAIVDANQAACEFYGYDRKRMLQLHVTDLNALASIEVAAEMLRARDKRKNHFEFIHRLANGDLRDVEVFSGPLSIHGRTLLHSIVFDVTLRKRAEAASQRLAAIVESSTDAIISKDLNGIITSWNGAAEKMFGYMPDEVIGKPIIMLLPPERLDEEVAILSNITQGTIVPPFDSKRRHKNGSLIDVAISVSPIRDAEGKVVGAAKIVRDIAERKHFENELAAIVQELAKSNKELEQFAYVASHDLQEPLRVVVSYLQFLEERYIGELDAKAKDFIGRAVAAAKRMQAMIQSLLAYSRISTRAKPFAECKTEAVLDHALEDLGAVIEARHARITHDPLPDLWGDETQIEFLFQNLIGNALKFCDREPPEVHIGAVKDGEGRWVFSVIDNGIGIEKEYYNRIFEIFTRLHARGKYEGTGIGLSTCKKIVERHGGTIWLESVPGQGSTFYFSLSPPPKKIVVGKEDDRPDRPAAVV